MIDKILSHYRILEELGRGGMGIVYKARDLSLERLVAIKVLPASALASKDDRARFYREARAAAQLHHPNIASVFEIDEVAFDGGDSTEPRPFIVMEYIDGAPLSDRIAEGPLALNEAVRIAIQISQALEAAHEKQIVHRDIKAANVMITKKGDAKVLDFGLAKTTHSTMLTRMGSTLGTVAYMSPEQARSEEVDRRTDLWAFGVTLYEMITGRHPFAGEYEQAVVYTILNEDPEPVTAIRTGVPMALEHIVNKCLKKEREFRYQHAGDLIADLKSLESNAGLLSGHTRSTPTSATSGESRVSGILRKKSLLPIVALVLLAGGWLAGRIWTGALDHASMNSVIRFTVPIPDGYETTGDGRSTIALSPDGMTIVYRQNGLLYRRKLDEEQAEPMAGTDYANVPAFSPDGEWIGFLQDDLFRKISPDGVVTNIGNASIDLLLGADWGSDDMIMLGRGDKGIWSLDVRSGSTTRITQPIDSSGEWGHAWPQLLNEGSDLLYSAVGQSGKWYDSRIVHMDLDSGERFDVVSGGARGRYVPTGHVLFLNEDGVMQAIPYDLKTHVSGTPFPVESGLLLSRWGAGASFAVSQTGTLVFARGNGFVLHDLYWYDRTGQRMESVSEGITAIWGLQIDPAGLRVATTLSNNRNDDVYVFERGALIPRQFTSHPASEGWSVWSPDGTRLAWERDTITGGTVILSANAGSGKDVEVLYRGRTLTHPTSWSPDGKWLFFEEFSEHNSSNIVAVDVEDSTIVRSLASGTARETNPRISPDGKLLAYDSNRTGEVQTYVTSFPEIDESIRLSRQSTSDARWSPAGNEIFFWQDRTLMAARYSKTPRFVVQRIDTLFSVPNLNLLGLSYDVRPDGQAFLIETMNPEARIVELNVVLNLFEEIRTQDR